MFLILLYDYKKNDMNMDQSYNEIQNSVINGNIEIINNGDVIIDHE